MEKGGKKMQNVYINDIPFDLFFKYFDKDSLEDKSLVYKLIDKTIRIATYSFSIGSNSYQFRTNSIDTEAVKQDIKRFFKDIIPNIENETFSPVQTGSISDDYLYDVINIQTGNIRLLHPYEFTFLNSSDQINDFVKIVDDEGTLNLVDLRRPIGGGDFFIIHPDVKLEKVNSEVNDYPFYVKSQANLVFGTIYKNERHKFRKIEDGKYVFVDPNGNETFSGIERSNFLRHNNLLRVGFNGLLRPEDSLTFRFNRGVIGIVQDVQGEKLSFYESFTTTKTITKTSFNPALTYEDEQIDDLLKARLSSLPLRKQIEVTSETKNVVKDVDNISLFKKIRVLPISKNLNEFTYRQLYPLSPISIGENLFAREFQEIVLIKNKRYQVIEGTNEVKNNNNQTIGILSYDNSNIPFVKFYRTGTQSVVSILGKFYNIDRESSGDSFIIMENRKIFGVLENPGNKLYFPIQCLTEYEDSGIEYIGTVNSILQNNDIVLRRYSVPNQSIDMSDVFDLEGYTMVNSNQYTKTRNIQDIYERNFYISERIVITRNTNTSIPIRKEFIEYSHQYLAPESTSRNFFKLTNDLKVKRLGSVLSSRPIKINDFRKKFSDFNHYERLGYLNFRGEIVPSDVLRRQKIDALIEMSGEFVSKKYDNFLVLDKISNSIDSLAKMRMYSEGFVNLIDKESENIRPLPIKNSVFKVDSGLYQSMDSEELTDFLKLDRSDLPIERYDIINELVEAEKNINSFQKLRDYERFPYNEKRERYFGELYKRLIAYSEKTQSTTILDEIERIIEQDVDTLVSRTTFKRELINNFISNFYDINSYEEINGRKYIENYIDFYKGKLDILLPIYIYNILVKTSEKKRYSRNYITETSRKELISNVLDKKKNWRVT